MTAGSGDAEDYGYHGRCNTARECLMDDDCELRDSCLLLRATAIPNQTSVDMGNTLDFYSGESDNP